MIRLVRVLRTLNGASHFEQHSCSGITRIVSDTTNTDKELPLGGLYTKLTSFSSPGGRGIPIVLSRFLI